MGIQSSDIRNVVVAGHGAAGKTNLIEAILFAAGATKRQGKTEEKSSHLDFADDEKARGGSIDAAIAWYEHRGKRINVIDTPGMPDFLGDAISGIYAADAMVLAVDAQAGVRVNTRSVFKYARDRGMPVLFVMTREDAENARFFDHLQVVQESFGANCVPLYIPNAEGAGFTALESTLKLTEASSDTARAINEKLVEAIVEYDEELMMRYLDGETIGGEELDKAFGVAFRAGAVFPVLVSSASKQLGVKELMDAISELFPSPLESKHTAVKGKGDAAESYEVPANGPWSGFIFKTIVDPFVGKLSFCRVVSGTMKGNTSFKNHSRDDVCKVGPLLAVIGKEQKAMDEAPAGSILAFAKVENVGIGDTVGEESFLGIYPNPPYPTPMVSLAVTPKSRADEQKISGSLAKLGEECPTFNPHREPDTHEMVVSGLSDLHLKIMLDRLSSRYAVGVESHAPKVPYKETVTSKGDARYRHKKQTGGAGQFAEVWMRVEPTPRGAGFQYEWEVVGGAISTSYGPSVEKGVKSVLTDGVIAGYPVVDVLVAVYDGKEHPVDSKDIAFQTAGRMAFKEAFQSARPVLLEPIMIAEITVPSDYMGDIMGDLNGRRGRIVSTEGQGSLQIIKANVPLAEMQTYSSQLRSMTAGEGSYALNFSHYEPVPGNVQQEIIARAVKKKDDDA